MIRKSRFDSYSSFYLQKGEINMFKNKKKKLLEQEISLLKSKLSYYEQKEKDLEKSKKKFEQLNNELNDYKKRYQIELRKLREQSKELGENIKAIK